MLGGELPAFAPTSHGYNQPFFKYANAQNKIAASEIKRKSEPLSFSFAPEVVLIPRLTATRQQTRRLSLDHKQPLGFQFTIFNIQHTPPVVVKHLSVHSGFSNSSTIEEIRNALIKMDGCWLTPSGEIVES